ncbi:MAG: SPOR domain-containing protein [Dysgonamonadaceae bacterium]|jgi:nucleoid DNA-binding protein|nr:SPOR domain-containing protein [Dysgonamonadaceae bacterium]
MQSVSSYIVYLLTKHECVIVPGLGAFVVSCPKESKEKKTGLLCPPAKFLGFNSDIRHNDGLLANTIAKGENSTYKDACLRISRYVDRITESMEKQVPVQIAWVGKLELSFERKVLFTPSHYLSCNADAYGMDNFYLPAISELIEKEEPLFRPAASTSIVRRTLSIAATILALLMVAIPLTDHSMQQPQTAQFLSLPAIASREPEVEKPEMEKPEVEKPVEEPVEAITPNDVEAITPGSTEAITPYYIVIASLPTETLAQNQMEIFRKQGFSTLGSISNGSKHRVYVAKFSDKAEANAFLIRFRNEYPQYNDAWLLVQRK